MEQLPSNAKKIPRVEAEMLEDEFGHSKIVDVDSDDVWGHDIARHQRIIDTLSMVPDAVKHSSKMRDKALETARQHVKELAKKGRGFSLTALTDEIVRDPQLLERVATESPAIQTVADVYEKQLDARYLFAAIFGEHETRWENEMRKRRGIYAMNFWYNAELSNDTWMAIATKHAEEFKKTALRFKESIGREVIRDTYKLIFGGVRNGIIPISQKRFMNTMGATSVTLADMMHPYMEELGGFYDVGNRKVALSSSLVQLDTFNPQKLQEVLIHEYVHALEGRTQTKYWDRARMTQEDYEEMKENGVEPSDIEEIMEEVGPFVEHARGGLQFLGRNSALHNEYKFKWMNEAVTDMVVDELLPERSNKAYPEFRKAVTYLMHDGSNQIPFNMLKDAYFEDYEPDAEQKIPCWKNLRAAINEAHGPKFLVAFDDAIHKEGVDKAIEKARTKTL